MTELPLQASHSIPELTQHALSAAGVGCWDLDLATGNVWYSAECDRIFGRAPQRSRMPLQDLYERFIPEDQASVAEAFEQVAFRGPIELEKRIRRASDDALRWIRFSGHAYGRDDKLAGIAGVVTDITAEHFARDESHHTEKMEALTYMAREVAHDFNNLLMVIGGSMELLSERIADDKAHRLFSAMNHGIERGVALTQKLMAFARPNDSQVRLVRIDELISSAGGLLDRASGDTVAVDMLSAQPAWCYCSDPDQLTAAMVNLVDNAREAMPRGGRLKLSTTVRHVNEDIAAAFRARPGDYVAVSFADTGAGISPEILDRVFEPFFTTKEDKKGHGFGLSQVYALASSSGGFVTIESELDRGTTATIHLPYASHPQDRRSD